MFLWWTLSPASLLAVGNLLQKIGLSQADRISHGQGLKKLVAKVLQSWHWWLGIALSAVATILYYGALAQFNMSLVQPMMALNPVLTALGGWLFLKEYLDKRTALAIIFTVMGIGFSSALQNEQAGYENPLNLGIFVALVLGLMAFLRFKVQTFELRKALIGGLGFGLSSVLIKSLSEYLKNPDIVVSALISNWAFMLKAFLYVLTYLLGFAYTQMGMTKGRALFIVPLSAALGMLIPSLAGIIAYNEPAGIAKVFALAMVTLGSLLFVRSEHVKT